MDVTSETLPPDVDQDDGEGDGDFLNVSISISELDGTWHNASTCIPADVLTPDAIAEALIQCIVGTAAARSSHTLIALQQRLLDWGTGE